MRSRFVASYFGVFSLCALCVACGDSGPSPSAPDGGALTCGPGTHAQGDLCLPDAPRDAGDAALPDANVADAADAAPDATPLSCGPGTHRAGDLCLPDDTAEAGLGYYDLRIAVSQAPADGITKIPVLAIGALADGSPSLESVVLNVGGGKGALSRYTFALGAAGTEIYYTPCSSVDPSCAGPVSISMALPSAPSKVLAARSLTLVAPTPVGSPAACLAGGNVVFFDGDGSDFIHPGIETITNGTFTSGSSTASHVGIKLSASNGQSGASWSFDFATDAVSQPIAAQVYESAQRWPFEAAGHPGLSVAGDGRGCNTVAGRFQIETLEWNGSALKALTATFEQHCEAGASALRGCIHYEQ